MPEDLVTIKTALISVADKTNLVEFAKQLRKHGVELMATGGTHDSLKQAGVEVRSLQDDMNLPQALNGRVKTLHSPLFAAILAKREDAQLREVQAMGVKPIDMVVCNFYPFEKTIAKPGVSREEVIENIDIGGPSMVRASSKNYEYVTVVPSPRHYDLILGELARNGGRVSMAARWKLAQDAFAITASYDIAVFNGLATTLGKTQFPDKFFVSASKFQEAKYGENPDQPATIYNIDGYSTMGEWQQLYGDSMSFNNYLDIGSGYSILEGFEHMPAAATVKHGNISGFGFAASAAEAYKLAHACDPEADFGGTVVVNRTVDADTAKLIGRNERSKDDSVYTEILIAPGYTEEALGILKAKQKKKMRLIKTTDRTGYPYDVKVFEGSILLQEATDFRKRLDRSKLTFPTRVKPDAATVAKLLEAWELVRRVPSNGIVVADGTATSAGGQVDRFWTLGVGTFRKRNGAVKIALDNAGERAKGAVCASDGFFPFRDSVDLLAAAGVASVIQPGGSVSDDDVVEAADEAGIAMAITHTRAFRH